MGGVEIKLEEDPGKPQVKLSLMGLFELCTRCGNKSIKWERGRSGTCYGAIDS